MIDLESTNNFAQKSQFKFWMGKKYVLKIRKVKPVKSLLDVHVFQILLMFNTKNVKYYLEWIIPLKVYLGIAWGLLWS